MRIWTVAAVALVGACATPTVTGNAQGGIMDWFATNERDAFNLAQAHCAKYGKDAVINQIVPRGGGSVTFVCVART